MPNEFEIDEKLTIAKNKPNKIEITEGKIESNGSLNISANSISLDTEEPVLIKKQLGVQSHITTALNIYTQDGIIWTKNGNISTHNGTVKGKIGEFDDVLSNSSQELKQEIISLRFRSITINRRSSQSNLHSKMILQKEKILDLLQKMYSI